MVFKDGLHQKIRHLWNFFLSMDLPSFYNTGTYNKDEFALMLSLPKEIKIKPMSPKEHFCMWRDTQKNLDPYVIHGYRRTVLRRAKARARWAWKNLSIKGRKP
jgi:hypothetical protein